MIVAIFGVLLLINRQTGGFLEGIFMFIFPIPMVAFSAKYGWKDSLPVFVCTVLLSFLFGTFSWSSRFPPSRNCSVRSRSPPFSALISIRISWPCRKG